MSLSDLRKNIKDEKELIEEVSLFYDQLDNMGRDPYSKEGEREMIKQALNSSKERLKMVNDAISSIVESLSLSKNEGREKVKNRRRTTKKPVVRIKDQTGRRVVVNKKDRKKFINELNISKDSLKRIKNGDGEKGKDKKRDLMEFKKPGIYARLSNKLFFNLSNKLVKKGYFEELEEDMTSAKLPILTVTYVSMILFSSLLVFILGIFYFISSFFYSFFSFTTFPEITFMYIGQNLAIAFILPIVCFFSLYYYPKSEASSIGKKMDQEVPFVAIHMSAIAGSGIEPTEIFKIIALGEEYPYTKKEMKKIINQVNIYGYDLLTALKTTARETSSERLSELLNGLSTIISGGGDISDFLDERAETLLFDYKMEREEYNKASETFMDIYIGVVIAAPMILTLLFVMMNMTNIGIGLDGTTLAILMSSGVAVINILFLMFLSIKQPTY